LKPVITVD